MKKIEDEIKTGCYPLLLGEKVCEDTHKPAATPPAAAASAEVPKVKQDAAVSPPAAAEAGAVSKGIVFSGTKETGASEDQMQALTAHQDKM